MGNSSFLICNNKILLKNYKKVLTDTIHPYSINYGKNITWVEVKLWHLKKMKMISSL